MESVTSCLRLDILYWSELEWSIKRWEVDGIVKEIGNCAGFYRLSSQLDLHPLGFALSKNASELLAL